ncbi:MAG: sulfatase-like hydrolase/transferase [Verrucomicrobiota bacterium]
MRNLAIAFFLFLTCWNSPAAENRPNLIFILVDDLGYGDLACQGAEDMETPVLDTFFKEGMVFENGYANCPVCSPTRASFLTGKYPDLAGVPGVIRTHAENSWGYLDPSAKTLPQVLGEAGYHSACIGKWHLGLESPSRPNERGFDYFKGFLGDMMDDYYDHQRHGIDYMYENESRIDPEGHATDLFSDWAADYIRERKGEDDPFFLYLAYNAPHTPIQPPQDWLEKVKAREEEIEEGRAKLVALIEHMDAGIGKVLSALKESGQAEETLVVFTSDNGGQLNVGANNAPWNGGKQNMLEGGLRVATAAVWPGVVPAGSSTDSLAMTMDWFDTFAEAGGAEIPEETDGESLLPVLLGDGPGPDAGRTLIWVRREGNPKYQGRAYYAIRKGEWKLLQNTPFESMTLYNLKNDPGESKPVNAPKIAAELWKELALHLQRAGQVPWQKSN